VTTLLGSGLISAAGGQGDINPDGGQGGAGGGGRVAVYAADLSGFNTTKITALGGAGPNGGRYYAGAGTVYLRDPNQPTGTLIIDGRGGGFTPLGLPGQQTFSIPDAVLIEGNGTTVGPENTGLNLQFQNTLTLDKNATINIQGPNTSFAGSVTVQGNAQMLATGDLAVGGPLNLTGGGLVQISGTLSSAVGQTVDGGTLAVSHLIAPSLSMTNGGVLTSLATTVAQIYGLDLQVSGTVSVDATSRIDVSGKGYLPGYTTGNSTQGAATGWGGGSYGGQGLSNYGTTNAVYGDYTHPDEPGSGPGPSATGGSGGGLVQITANVLQLDGQLLANGGTGGGTPDYAVAGGSGGGIYVNVTTLLGSGLISAAGGQGDINPDGGQGGAGGGGRVAVYAADLSGFNTTKITAFGGTGPNGGRYYAGAGTVYLRDPNQPTGTLVIDGRGGGFTPLGLPGQQAFTIPDAVLIEGQYTTVGPENSGLNLQFQNTLTISSGATLQTPSNLIVNGVLNWSGGSISAGEMTLGSGGVANITNASSDTLNAATVDNAGTIDVQSGNWMVNTVWTNSGTIEASNGGSIVSSGGALTSTGIIEANGTSTISLNNSSVTINSPGALIVQPSATVNIAGSLFGNTTDVDLYEPQGTVNLDGSGTSSVPQFLEVMSQDLGNVVAGFNNNFAYGTLAVGSNDYVRLVDNAHNSTGTGPEALYVNSLIVPSGATLDLNGLHLYVRSAQVNGTITGGSLMRLSAGGPLQFATPTSGTLQSVGELDDWTLFGRADQSLAVIVNTGSSGSPAPVQPSLNFAQVLVVDASGNVLATASNSQSGTNAAILGVTLPADGTYHIRVSAPTAKPSSTGSYVLSAYDTTIHTATTSINQTTYGQINTPYNQDRWTFSAVANQQITFNLLADANSSFQFSLTGPNGYTGFTGLNASSGLLTLPASGTYTLTVGGGATGAYAFQIVQTMQTNLTLGSAYQGTLTGSGQAQLFVVNVPSSEPLFVSLQDSSAGDQNELYAKFGTPPTREVYDYGANGAGSSQSLLVPSADAGTWYVLVYAEAVATAPSSFTIRADASPVLVTSVAPVLYGTDSVATMTLNGAGFTNATTVALVSSDGTTVYPATSVSFDTFTQLTATIDLTGVPQGTYSVRVTNAVGSDTLPAAFTVTAAGQANFETHLILPSAVGRHISSTFYIEYSNTGTVAMPAPVVLLESSVADDLPLFTLDKSLVVSGFWTSAIPQGYSNTVEILTSGKVPGVLEPGESVTVPVYYAGMLQPWNFSESQFKFDLRVFTTTQQQKNIDWLESVLPGLKPAGFSTLGWGAVSLALASQLGIAPITGPTVSNSGGYYIIPDGSIGAYVTLLDNEASYLGQLGEYVTDVSQLWGFAVAQADNELSPIGPALASATDDSVAIPGTLSLSFSRVFAESVNGRCTLGPLGYGWSTPWQTTASTASDGTVTITGADGSQRVFQPDSRQAGAFFSQPGDTGSLTDDGHGGYLLTEADGTATDYNPNGTLNYVQDTNGNRITAGYTDGLLTSLTASSGQWIAIGYNSAGFISTVTDSEGRTTTYSYDTSYGDDELTSVTGFDGQTTSYTYSWPDLRSITFPGNTHEYFTYDNQGRLAGISADNGAQPLTFAYSMGEVSVTDGTGDRTQFYYNEQGLLVKTIDPLGNATLNTYDSNYNLTQLTNALGQSEYFTYNGAGEVTSSTDFLGNTTYFTYAGPFNNLSSMTDANGNTTTYAYDSEGDLLSTTYANGTTETSTFDPEGNATSFLNANGQATQYTYNSSGQMLTETFSDGSQYTYSYNAFGELATATDATGTTTFTYDATTELLTKVAYPNGTSLTFTYNAAGQRTSMVDQTGFTVNYAYDAVGRLSKLTDAHGSLIVTYTYDADSRLSEKTNGNGTYTTYQYDADGNVLHLVNYAAGGTINSRFDYTYNSLGLETSEATLDGTWTYTYDVDGQLIDAVFASTNPTVPSQDLAYSYDAMGNRISTVINGVTTAYTTNDVNEYTSVGGVADTYDADGNLTSDGTNTYTYNSLNQLIGVSGPSGTTTYTYNALGQRVASTTNGQTTQYLIDPSGLGNVIGEYSGSGALIADYTYGLGLTSQVTTEGSSYYDFDALGSASELTNAAGIVLDSYAYGPFGLMVEKSKAASNPFEFVGEYGLMDDGNGLIHMGVRVYDSSTGGFLTRDPLNSEPAYLYANDTPTNRVDPLGLSTTTVTIPIEPPFGGLAISVANNPVTGERFVGVGVSLSSGGVFFWNSPNGTQGFSTSFPGIGGGISVSTGSPPSVPTSIYIAGWAAGHIPLLWPGAANLFDGGQFSGWWSLWGQGQSSLQGSPGQGIGASLRWGFFIRVHAPVLNGTGGEVVTAPNANSEDPNSMVGPGGYGTPNFVADAGATLPYQVDFENSSSATAPAQAVTITDQLDPNLD